MAAAALWIAQPASCQPPSKLAKGPVANTAFAILSPDGQPALRGRGPGRGPRDLFDDAAEMAKGMNALAKKYSPKKVHGIPALPITLNVKVGLAVAAGDLQPLVVVLSDNRQRREEMESKVAKLAWSSAFEGRLTYATAASVNELSKIQGRTVDEGVLFIEPDIFGAAGKVVNEVAVEQLPGRLADATRETVRAHVRISKNRRDLAELGLKKGIFYETGIPVSGRGEAADRERYKQQLDLKKDD